MSRGQFTNTFEKGMMSDMNILQQPNGSYRYAKNCNIISQDGNNYVVKDCLGNLITFTINAPYNAVYTVVGALPMVLKFFSLPGELYCISTNSRSTSGAGYCEIGKIEYLPYGEGVQPKTLTGQYNGGYIPLYHSADMNMSQAYMADGFGFSENEFIARLYWTDNFNEPRVFNVKDPQFTTYISTGSLVVGQQYMVVEGAVTHSAVNYGPGLTAGNVFTAVGINFTDLTTPTPTAKVIAYYPYQLLDWTPSRKMGNISFLSYGAGAVMCGNKVYFYRLGTNDGIYTSWSYGCAPIHVGTQNELDYLTSPTVAYQDFVGAGLTTTLVNSGRSVRVTIDNIDTNFDFVELACAEFDQLIDTPRIISIVAVANITPVTTSVTLEHTGSNPISELTLSDITLFPASILKCKALATSDNFNLPANITERSEFILDMTPVTLDNVYYPMLSHMDATSCSLSGMVPSGVSPTCGANPAAGAVYPWSRWKVTAGTAIYNGTSYTVGKVIVGVSGAGNDSIDTATNPGTQVRPCVTRNQYTTSLGARVENAIEIVGSQGVGFWDYKEPAVHHHVQGLWGNQTYRPAIILVDKKGNPMYAQHLGDHTTPIPQLRNPYSGLMTRDQIGNTGQYAYSLVASGLKVSGITIPPSVINEISGFMIVRAVRDASIICQGILTQNTHTGATPDVYKCGAYIPVSESDDAVVSKNYTFISPDIACNVPLPGVVGAIGDTIENAAWVDAFDYGGGVRVRGAGPAASEQVYSKVITTLGADTTSRTGTITYWAEVNDGDDLDIGNGVTFENKMKIDAAAGTVIEGGCVTGGVDYDLDGHEAIGCKKVVLSIATDFKHYGPSANDYSSVAANAQTEKLLVNYKKTGYGNPYGGIGEQALANTLYISTGHFQPITTQVKTDTFDGTNYVFNNIEVFGGDCFTCLVDVGYGLWNDDFTDKYSYAWTFPCECNSNYNLRRGRKTSNVEMYYTGTALTESIAYLDPSAEIRLEDYSYNRGYSSGTLVNYPAMPANLVNSAKFKTRIRHSLEKTLGETIDSFRRFAIGDYIDLDGHAGEINNVRPKDGRIIVWQNDAIATVPILERQLLGADFGDATTIGTGGVLDRFDTLNSFFGNQHQWSLCDTDTGFMWFDMRRKAVVTLDMNGGIAEVSEILYNKSLFSEIFVEAIGNQVVTASTLGVGFLNSPTFDPESDRPLLGVGIISVFDPKFKRVYMTFKFKARRKITVSGVQVDGFWSKDFTIGFIKMGEYRVFEGFYDWFPAIVHNHGQLVLAMNNPKNTTQYIPSSLIGMSFVVGETLPGTNQSEYVCIADVTISSGANLPNGASGATYWVLINASNNVMVLNQPAVLGQTVAPDYVYNMFDGRVVNNVMSIVVNPPSEEAFEVTNIVQVGPYNVNYTTIQTEATNQSAQDVNIRSTDRNYRFDYRQIKSNLPLSTSIGRLVDFFLKITFTKKNYTTNPTVLTTSVKILEKVRSMFREKR